MTRIEIGTLEEVPIRDVWAKEAGDFTPWLAENKELMSTALRMDLELVDQEVSVGRYSADLVMRDASSNALVVVENMFGSTDHDHLGKLITYAAGLEARYAVLLSETIGAEHRSALNWLNSISTEGCGFFGLSLEVWRIGDSIPAPHLRVDVQPDDWSKGLRALTDRTFNERDQLRRRFWEGVQSRLREVGKDWAGRGQPSRHNHMVFKSRKGINFNGVFSESDGEGRLRVEAYVDTGDEGSTGELYADLLSRRPEIEESFGRALEWESLEGKRASRICSYFPETVEIEDEALWPEAQDWMVPALDRLRAAVAPVLDDL